MAIKEIYDAILAYDKDLAAQKTKQEIEAGIDPSTILNDGLIAALTEVGEKFSSGELFVPEMLLAARAMKSGLEILKPYLVSEKGVTKGTVVIGTVKGDLHDIGKNLVATMVEGAGYNVVDLGVDVPPEKFIDKVEEQKAEVVALSALLTTTMPAIEQTIKRFHEAKIPVKTIIGGAPVTQEFADRIGADGYSPNAPGAAKLVARFLDS